MRTLRDPDPSNWAEETPKISSVSLTERRFEQPFYGTLDEQLEQLDANLARYKAAKKAEAEARKKARRKHCKK